MIIVEGLDGSGKSTLIRKISQEIIGLTIATSEGPPKNKEELTKRWNDKLHIHYGTKSILDRAEPISERIYGPILRGVDFFGEDWPISQLHEKKIPLIYCRPPSYILLNPKMHVPRSSEDPQHLEQVLINQLKLMTAYDQIMAGIPHVEYDWTTSSERYWHLMVVWLRTHFQQY
jgi:hypothetical protein